MDFFNSFEKSYFGKVEIDIFKSCRNATFVTPINCPCRFLFILQPTLKFSQGYDKQFQEEQYCFLRSFPIIVPLIYLT